MARDYYQILGVARSASAKEIKRAYRRLAHRYHPDKNTGEPRAEERFKEITEAYDVLGDPERRRRYDRFGAASVGGGRAAASSFGDVFSEIFADFFGRRERGRAAGRDRHETLTVDLRLAVQGGERTLQVLRARRCAACAGTGARPGTAPQICHACGGSGEIRVQQGLLSVSKACGYCKARGRVITDPCPACSGEGHRNEQAQLKVRIPPGTADGTVLRYVGEGEPGGAGGKAGDLRVTIRVEPDPLFRRDGADLFVEVPITFAEAALGAQVEVPTLSGLVRMTIPPGTQSGRVFRLRGKGVPQGEGAPGDQQVTVIVETPVGLEPAVRQRLTEVAELADERHYPLRSAFRRKVRGA